MPQEREHVNVFFGSACQGTNPANSFHVALVDASEEKPFFVYAHAPDCVNADQIAFNFFPDGSVAPADVSFDVPAFDPFKKVCCVKKLPTDKLVHLVVSVTPKGKPADAPLARSVHFLRQRGKQAEAGPGAKIVYPPGSTDSTNPFPVNANFITTGTVQPNTAQTSAFLAPTNPPQGAGPLVGNPTPPAPGYDWAFSFSVTQSGNYTLFVQASAGGPVTVTQLYVQV
jgi:hypothetical protein